MTMTIPYSVVAVALLMHGFVVTTAATTAAATKNVLLITVDDLRVQLSGAYGMTETITPNLDALAQDSLTFQRAYCQMAVCSPSRNSFLTGRRPDTTRVWNFVDSFRNSTVGADWTTLPGYFKQNGYFTYGAGKLFHPGSPANNDFPESWTSDSFNPFYWGNGPPIGDAGACHNVSSEPAADVFSPLAAQYGKNGERMVCFDLHDKDALLDNDNASVPQAQQAVEYDHRVATRAIEAMRYAQRQNRNFFIAAGFRRPHLEWRAPKKFWDAYAAIAENMTLATHQTIGEDVPVLAFEMNGGMGLPYTTPTGESFQISPHGPPLPDDLQRGLRRGYYAVVSFMDFEVGRLLASLDDLGMTANTLVIFHADHGWKLGEHGDWSKCTNWELDARVPLIIRAPWLKASAGKTTYALAELIDIFPTAVEMSGLPALPESEGLEGRSLAPVFLNPEAESFPNRSAAFTQYPRCPSHDMVSDPEGWECLSVPKRNISVMGYSVRTTSARYTEWRSWNLCLADWSPSGLIASELYDHTGDTGRGPGSLDSFEYANLASDPARSSQVSWLSSMLRHQFRAASREPRC